MSLRVKNFGSLGSWSRPMDRTGYRMAVEAEPGKMVLFSSIEWPNKATRDA